tara:strand:- start:873 stop:1085 length:213 start_codon:yes stop_codon:yes gene_type:complete
MGKVKEYYYEKESKDIEEAIKNYGYADGQPVPDARLVALDIFEDLKPQFHDIDEIQDGVQNYYDEELCYP